MQFINYLKSKLPFYVALSFTFILASCGSYQYVGYDNDGIYGSEAIVTEQPVTSNNSSYYKNYFAEKSQQLEIPEEDIIFTDIDSYEGDYNEVEDSNYDTGNAGWGQTSDSLKLESRFSPWVAKELHAMGHEIEMLDAFDETVGHAGCIIRDPSGTLRGGWDPRSDGAVSAF